MDSWTKERIEQMIADGIEEGPSLDYKAAGALFKSDEKRTEITRDVSAFANSSGGTIIYGVSEFSDAARKHLPEQLDPINRAQYSREWLEHVIQNIEPKIDGLRIHPVTIDNTTNLVCYVVEIPESDTAHQAADCRYYRRYNFERQVMRDRDIRDVMSRRRHPKLKASMRILSILTSEADGEVQVKLENVGSVMPLYVMAHLELPLSIGAESKSGEVRISERGGKHFVTVNLLPGIANTQRLFPGSTMQLRTKFSRGGELYDSVTGRELESVSEIKASIFADDMPKIEASISLHEAQSGWVAFC